MIIRSQNKKIIEQFDAIHYVKYGSGPLYLQTRRSVSMAEYSSEEKAMKVLEDLHSELIHGSKYFDFPTDEDVKV